LLPSTARADGIDVPLVVAHVFLGTDGDVLVGVGNFVYVLDVESKRIGPVMDGGDFIALARPFSKQVNF
jgi:hypothetical protein